ncbi:MAG: DUF6152 family protein [Candidatus Rariloculaceae bacterium]
MNLRTLFLVAFAGLSMPVLAHHSHGNYEMTTYTQLEGVVTEFIYMNPHSWVYMSVEDEDGDSAIWALETGSVRALERAGVSADTIAPGDKISVRCHQLKDGANGCLLGFLTPPGGEENEWD